MRFLLSFPLSSMGAALLAVALLFPASPLRAQDKASFLSAIEDLPLMEGLAEDEGGVVFDSAQGRIVEAYATGSVSEGAVRDFYDETLPQLGWKRLGEGRFRRENEILKVEFPGGPGAAPPLTVGFRLMPAGN